MFLLDTDHLVILQRQSEPEYGRLRTRMNQHSRASFSLSVVSFHEQVLGANAYISQAKSRSSIVRGYQMLEVSLIDFSYFQVLPFDEPAAIEFDSLRSQGVRVGTMDLRIAAIAVSNDLTVLTRNTVDFQRVPGLRVEDWTLT
jgi:tRNA(fMet)-specific endonuclease VapC